MDLEKYNKRISNLFKKSYGRGLFDFRDKEDSVFLHNLNVLNRTQQMFEYEGLPDTIPKRNLELLLQINGYCGIAETPEGLFCFYGGLGGEPNAYYMPTIFTVANPALNFYKNLRIDEECVIIPNDSLYLGLMPLITRYNTMISEGELSLFVSLINSRLLTLISAGDDNTLSAAEEYLKKLESGKLGAIGENQFLEGIRSQPVSQTNNQIISIIESMQYERATLYNELGLSANFNMKREALNSAESAINNDILLPLVDNMLECRREALDKVNNMFGTEITVKLSSSWEDNEKEIMQDLQEQDGEPEQEQETEEDRKQEDETNEAEKTE